jgi:hypothetical protein
VPSPRDWERACGDFDTRSSSAPSASAMAWPTDAPPTTFDTPQRIDVWNERRRLSTAKPLTLNRYNMQGLFWTQEEREDPGRYGDCTQDNVAAFQYKHGIEVDDQRMIGPWTWREMEQQWLRNVAALGNALEVGSSRYHSARAGDGGWVQLLGETDTIDPAWMSMMGR